MAWNKVANDTSSTYSYSSYANDYFNDESISSRALPCIIYPYHYYYTNDNFDSTSNLKTVCNIARSATNSSTIYYNSGRDSWNNIIYNNNYLVKYSSSVDLVLGYVEPGTRPSFKTTIFDSTSSNTYTTTGGLCIEISRTNTTLTIKYQKKEWSATGDLGNLTQKIEKISSQFSDGVIPKRLLIEFNSGGGSGGSSGWFTYGGGGQAGGYWCGVIDISSGYVYIYCAPRAASVNYGGNTGNDGANIYMWRSTDPSYNSYKLVLRGGQGGSKNNGGDVSSYGDLSSDTMSGYWQIAYQKGATGAGNNGTGTSSSSVTSKASAYCTRYSAAAYTQQSRGGYSGGVPNSGGGGGASAFAAGAGGHNSASKGAGGGGGDTGAASGAGGEGVIKIYY